MNEAKVVFAHKATLGEGSLWDEGEGVLYWVDILENKVHCFDPVSRSNRSWDVGEDVGTVVLTEHSALLLALRNGFASLDPATGTVEKIHDPEKDLPNNRFNDGKCDPQGRFWAGTMAYDLKKGAGSLYVLDGKFQTTKKLGGVTISNGLAWNGKQNLFFYIDSPTRSVACFDYDQATGHIANRRVIAEIPESMGLPDGMTIDTEDHLWVALFGGAKVIRIDPAGGEIVYAVDVAAKNVTSCAFGGQDFDQLYITTAGSLFRAEVPFQGRASFRFKRFDTF